MSKGWDDALRYYCSRQLAEARFARLQAKYREVDLVLAFYKRLQETAAGDGTRLVLALGSNWVTQRAGRGYSATPAGRITRRRLAAFMAVTGLDEWGTSRTCPRCHKYIDHKNGGRVAVCKKTCSTDLGLAEGVELQRDEPAAASQFLAAAAAVLFGRRPRTLVPPLYLDSARWYQYWW